VHHYVESLGKIIPWMQGRSQAPFPGNSAIEILYHIFRLNFSSDMSKMHYFSNKFSKIVKRLGFFFLPPSPQRLLTWASSAFEADYYKSNLKI